MVLVSMRPVQRRVRLVFHSVLSKQLFVILLLLLLLLLLHYLLIIYQDNCSDSERYF